MKTKTGELTIQAASEIRLLTKSLRPLPDKFHGLADRKEVPPALRRPDHERGNALHLPRPQPHRRSRSATT
jgi:hypothetical protein